MAKIDALQVAAFLAEQGLEVPAELQAKIENAVADAAYHHLSERVVVPLSDEDDNAKNRKARNETVTRWQEETFDLAARMVSDFRHETKNVGRGQQVEWSASVDTPHGKLLLRLRKDVEES